MNPIQVAPNSSDVLPSTTPVISNPTLLFVCYGVAAVLLFTDSGTVGKVAGVGLIALPIFFKGFVI